MLHYYCATRLSRYYTNCLMLYLNSNDALPLHHYAIAPSHCYYTDCFADFTATLPYRYAVTFSRCYAVALACFTTTLQSNLDKRYGLDSRKSYQGYQVIPLIEGFLYILGTNASHQLSRRIGDKVYRSSRFDCITLLHCHATTLIHSHPTTLIHDYTGLLSHYSFDTRLPYYTKILLQSLLLNSKATTLNT